MAFAGFSSRSADLSQLWRNLELAANCRMFQHHLSSSCSRITLVVCVTDVVKVLMDARTVVTIVESSTAGSALIHMISPSVPCTHCGELGHYNV